MFEENVRQEVALSNAFDQSPLLLHKLPEQSDNGSPFKEVCLLDMSQRSGNIQQAFLTRYTGNSFKYDFLMDVCSRAASQLSMKYFVVLLAQAKLFTESALHCNAAAPYERVEGGSHDLLYFSEGMAAALHSEEFHMAQDGLHGLSGMLALLILPFKYIAHRIKHAQIESHPAKLFQDLDANDLACLFKSLCLAALSSWDHKVLNASIEEKIREEQTKWIKCLTESVDKSLRLLSSNHTNLSLQDTHDRALALTTNQQRQLTMTDVTYPVANYSQLIDVYKILFGITESNESYLTLNDEVADNLRQHEEITGRFLLDVMAVFLKPNNNLVTRNKVLSVLCGYATTSIDKARGYYERVNHALAYVSEHMMSSEVEGVAISPSEQRPLINRLIFNYLEHECKINFESFKGLGFLHSQYMASYPALSIKLNEIDDTFTVASHTGGLHDSNMAGLQQIVSQKDAEIEMQTRRIDGLSLQVNAVEQENHHLQEKITDLQEVNNDLLDSNARLLGEFESLESRTEALALKNIDLQHELDELRANRQQDEERRTSVADRQPALRNII